MSEAVSYDEIQARLRRGYSFDPRTPGLKKAARDLIRPLVESMAGREIIYRCRVPWLMRVDSLEVDDDGFRAVAAPIREIRDGFMSVRYDHPLHFGIGWEHMRLSGSAICVNMLADHFHVDPAVVTEVKAAAARNAAPKEIWAILNRE